MASTLIIRPAREEDIEPMRQIYEHYVLTSAATFNGVDEVPAPDAFAAKVARVSARHPWLAAQREGRVVGFAYAAPYRQRAAYDWDVETTIYLAPDERGRGTGRALYSRLEEILRRQHVRTMYACVTHSPHEDDPHLTNASEHFHTAMGFAVCGTMRTCGYKFGCWYDILWLEKRLVEGEGDPEPFIPFSEL
ncbi:MAG: N-acetyltransferase [Eggerthellaceae bacterium]|nr:N-acetyltransferase [Eggerthellaceae bacterium]